MGYILVDRHRLFVGLKLPLAAEPGELLSRGRNCREQLPRNHAPARGTIGMDHQGWRSQIGNDLIDLMPPNQMLAHRRQAVLP